jgi:hypothetical protein
MGPEEAGLIQAMLLKISLTFGIFLLDISRKQTDALLQFIDGKSIIGQIIYGRTAYIEQFRILHSEATSFSPQKVNYLPVGLTRRILASPPRVSF